MFVCNKPSGCQNVLHFSHAKFKPFANVASETLFDRMGCYIQLITLLIFPGIHIFSAGSAGAYSSGHQVRGSVGLCGFTLWRHDISKESCRRTMRRAVPCDWTMSVWVVTTLLTGCAPMVPGCTCVCVHQHTKKDRRRRWCKCLMDRIQLLKLLSFFTI